jgi:PTH1 family peptidyl-tRNA hydrolase
MHHSGDWKKALLSRSYTAASEICHTPVKFIKPQTFMNLSGKAVSRYVQNHETDRLIVIHDDAHIPQGTFKISYGKNDGGHNGITSIIESLHSKNFIRIRVGIAPGESKHVSLERYVLEKMPMTERGRLEQTTTQINTAIEHIITQGLPSAMSTYNV